MATRFVYGLKNKLLIVLSIIAVGLGVSLSSQAQNDPFVMGSGAPSLVYKIFLKNSLTAGAVRSGTFQVSFFERGAMRSFYENREYKPFWIRSQGLEVAEQTLSILKDSWTHGLNPDHYHVEAISAILSNTFLDKARLEVLLTDAVMRYGHDVSGMRIDPGSIKQKSEYWRIPLSGHQVMDKIASSASPVKTIQELSPNTVLYRALQKELVSLQEKQAEYDHLLPMDFGGDHHFTPGERHHDVKKLRVRLGLEERSSSYYDDDTAAMLMSFQREHGLEPDGIIGSQTLAVLNRTRTQQIHQIIANMERLRWLDREKPDKWFP
jgi:murein L,D-transpeptidase YcbB/YkuD